MSAMSDQFLTQDAPSTDFEERLIQALNEGALVQLLSIGHRTGLLDVLADSENVTSHELAEKAGLEERYVREWLGGLTVAGVLHHDPEAQTYGLPPAHGALLTGRSEFNFAIYAQYLPLLGTVEDDVVACFRDGGGVPYERYTRFHEIMAQDSAQTVLPTLFDGILPLVPGLGERLEQGIDVLDLGCGSGLALVRLARRFPRSHFLGYDLSAEAIEQARRAAARESLDNLRFEIRDLSGFDREAEESAFDLVVTFDAIHDQAQPLNLLVGIRRTLRPEGVYLAQDIHSSSHHHRDREHPMGTLLYTVSLMHCMTVSLAQGGEGLGTMWGRKTAREYFERAGFGQVEVHRLPHDMQNDYWVLRP